MEVADTLPVIACAPSLFIATVSCSCNDFHLVLGTTNKQNKNCPTL